MTVTGMAWHLLLPCHTERGEPGSRPFPNSCPDLRKADCSFAQAEVQSRRGFASCSSTSPPPCSETLAGPRAASPVWWVGEGCSLLPWRGCHAKWTEQWI